MKRDKADSREREIHNVTVLSHLTNIGCIREPVRGQSAKARDIKAAVVL